MRAIHLANYFVTGCIASSFLGWVASLHPMATRAIAFLVAAALIVWGLCWLLDFSVSGWLKISVNNLQALLLASLASIVIGAGVFLCS
jgi:membrane-anchored glycerophosphoryl diester phosphodiesterase (GDPDase)